MRRKIASRGRKTAVRAVGVALLLAVPSAGIAGCGSDGDATETTQAQTPPNILERDEVTAAETGTPERALLDWWQTVQEADGAGAAELTSPDTLDQIGEEDFEEMVDTRGKGFQGIEVFKSFEYGDEASVRAALLSFQPSEPGAPPPSDPTAAKPVTFVMVDDGGEWLFDSADYLDVIVENFKVAQANAAKEQSKTEKQDSKQGEDSADAG